jgi:fumarate hydratase subunit alpha
MRVLEASRIGKAIESLCLEISRDLPPDVIAALENARPAERSQAALSVLDLIIENARIARETGVPLCQDTGIFTLFLDVGKDTGVEGDLAAEASAAVAAATRKGALRASVVRHPVDERENTGDNTPAFIDVSIGAAEKTRLAVLAKGGGSEMASRAAMLTPGAGWEGVKDFVLKAVSETGARSCPPLILGIGIGGTFDSVTSLAKKALLVPLDTPAADARTEAREREMLSSVNGLGIGPGALGGTTTSIGVKILEAPCHMASLPVALSVCCHSLRRRVIDL